jgi:hypothetical protein
MNSLANMNPANARLPQAYENAKTALAECASLDECKQWSDRAAALLSYAKQANDDELEQLSKRIRARAIRRAGELLQAVEPAKGGDRRSDQAIANDSLISRQSAAREAGMSDRQQFTAVRVANIPRQDFDRQVDQPKPPTISQLAQQGIKPRPLVDLKGRDPKAFNICLHFVGDIEGYASDLVKNNLEQILPLLQASEIDRIRAAISRIDAIHDRIVTRI